MKVVTAIAVLRSSGGDAPQPWAARLNQQERVTYILIGGLARVVAGSDELTRGLDLTPHPRAENLLRLERALQGLGARSERGGELSLEGHDFNAQPVLALRSEHGEIKVVPTPAGTRGYEDLHRATTREYLGDRVRTEVASPGDLVRMLWVLGRADDSLRIETMQRVVELDRGLGLGSASANSSGQAQSLNCKTDERRACPSPMGHTCKHA